MNIISIFDLFCLIILKHSIVDGFCDHYKNNGYKVMIHSPDNEHLILITGKHFWIVTQSDSKLVFKWNDTIPYGSIESFGGMATIFSFGFSIDLALDPSKPDDITIVNDFFAIHETDENRPKNPLGWMAFIKEKVETHPILVFCTKGLYVNPQGEQKTCGYFEEDKGFSIGDITLTVSFRFTVALDYSGKHVYSCDNLFLWQRYSDSLNKYERKLFEVETRMRPELNHSIEFVNTLDKTRIDDYSFIEQIDPTLEVIGFFYIVNDATLHVLLRSKNSSVIQYCTALFNSVGNCLQSNHKVLVDCSPPMATTVGPELTTSSNTNPDAPHNIDSSSLILYVIIGFVVVIIVFGVICFAYVYMKKVNRRDVGLEPQLPSEMPSIETIDSNTGTPTMRTPDTDSGPTE